MTKHLSTARRSLVAFAAVTIAAGCSSALQGKTGNLPGMEELRSRAFRPEETAGSGPFYVYVADNGAGKVEILENPGYGKVGTISRGIDGPGGDFLDKNGNLYVANTAAADITEYAPRDKVPSFTYSAGMYEPLNVAVDARGHIFEADNWGSVNEYAQGSNTVLHSCQPGAQPVSGVAIDKAGDVFVDYGVYNPFSGGSTLLAEYAGGLAGCRETVHNLGYAIEYGGGMAIDKDGNLIIPDQDAGAVDIVAPPYTSVTRTLGSSNYFPLNVTLNKKNDRAYVVAVEGGSGLGTTGVYVLEYPSGTLLTTLGNANGLASPSGAVEAPNAVY